MTASVLSTDTAPAYSEFIWWWLHQSDDPERMAAVIGSYYDESSVDGGGPVSAVGGVVVRHRDATWLGIEWYKILDKFPELLRSDSDRPYVHMKEFGKDEALADLPVDSKRELFRQLTPLINEFKYQSIGATLTPQEYRDHFNFLPKQERVTIHTSCFVLVATVQAKLMKAGKYDYKVPFMLDRGIPQKESDALDVAHKFITGCLPDYQPEHDYQAGGLTWEDDKEIPCLQVADIVAWTVRRDRAKLPFDKGVESLRDILTVKHSPAHYEDSWMADIATDLRARIKGA
jgi:hypothetical protein